ncbi:hypothetical protein SAMN04489743_3839 [Pseudarthrobacter equi]|uniref:Uncharacterized protein n=2 Tax=Pseudarthrobacter equi TaxID=728066 RepID=A0A1H2BP92_9MICC|nr:hypothetical protein SAMN04489743_3839 [Pseudarthrobacter equi]
MAYGDPTRTNFVGKSRCACQGALWSSKQKVSMMELIMKWYRYVHPLIFIASFMPLVLSLVPFWQGVAIPLVALVPYAANEILLARREK